MSGGLNLSPKDMKTVHDRGNPKSVPSEVERALLGACCASCISLAILLIPPIPITSPWALGSLCLCTCLRNVPHLVSIRCGLIVGWAGCNYSWNTPTPNRSSSLLIHIECYLAMAFSSTEFTSFRQSKSITGTVYITLRQSPDSLKWWCLLPLLRALMFQEWVNIMAHLSRTRISIKLRQHEILNINWIMIERSWMI